MIAREMHAESMKNMQLESMFCPVFAGVSFCSSKGGNSYSLYIAITEIYHPVLVGQDSVYPQFPLPN